MARKAKEQPIDTRFAAVKAFLDVLSVLAKFEPKLRKGWPPESVAAAKARRAHKGDRPCIDPEAVRLHAEREMLLNQIAREAEHSPENGLWLPTRGSLRTKRYPAALRHRVAADADPSRAYLSIFN
ncbi:hypothetical protein [Sphingomonas sp. Leaf67]|uniref:hypothetical protein n=1 Tax=Sphingomonas sp. Leaf67 TaxID=1736230 RepID=UPI0012E2FE41|nr:hypothetical protein [Sphingomonas sp. Leaf67]